MTKKAMMLFVGKGLDDRSLNFATNLEVRGLNAHHGQQLKAGDLVARIDPANARAELTRLVARQELLQAGFLEVIRDHSAST